MQFSDVGNPRLQTISTTSTDWNHPQLKVYGVYGLGFSTSGCSRNIACLSCPERRSGFRLVFNIWLVVYLSLWKIWKSDWIIIPAIGEVIKFMFQTTTKPPTSHIRHMPSIFHGRKKKLLAIFVDSLLDLPSRPPELVEGRRKMLWNPRCSGKNPWSPPDFEPLQSIHFSTSVWVGFPILNPFYPHLYNPHEKIPPNSRPF